MRDEADTREGEAKRTGDLRRGRRDVEHRDLARERDQGKGRIDGDVADLARGRARLLCELLFGALRHREQVDGHPGGQRRFDVLGVAFGDFLPKRPRVPQARFLLCLAEGFPIQGEFTVSA